MKPERPTDSHPAADWWLSLEADLPPEPDTRLFEWPGRYGLALGRCGDEMIFSTRVGGTFVVAPETNMLRCFTGGPDAEVWRDVLVRRVLPRTCVLAGALAIHAASVARGDFAILLAASSGTGKSTLSAALERDGWSLLSDDISILWPQTRRVAPTVSGASLWPEARQGLDVPEAQCRPMPVYDGKKAYLSGAERTVHPAPLKAVIGLVRSQRCKEPILEPLVPRETLGLLQRQVVHYNPSDAGEVAASFARLGPIAEAVAGYRLTYPSRFDALPTVGRLLETLL